MFKKYWVYIIASQYHHVLYVGVTNNLSRRMREHELGDLSIFSSKYKTTKLLHVEEYAMIHDALVREKRLKKWNRAWKINLITQHNPTFDDLSQYLLANFS